MKKILASVLIGFLIGSGSLIGLTRLGFLTQLEKAADHDEHKDHDSHDGHEDHGDHDQHSEEVELSADAIRSAGITVSEVQLEKLVAGLDVTAVAQCNQDRLAHVGPRIAGALVKIRKSAVLGKEVKKDQILAVLDGIELGKAKAAYLKQKALLKTAKNRVEKETALFTRLNRLEIGVEAIQFLERKQLLEVAKRNYDRESKLFKTRASSEKDLLAAQAQYLSAQARFNAVKDKLLLLGVSEAALNSLTRKTARSLNGVGTTSAREKLDSIVAYKTIETELQAACELLYTLGLRESDIELLGHDHDEPISSFYLRAPISGRIIEKHATIGEIVGSGKSIFVIADLSTIWILLDIYEKDVAKIKIGQKASIQAPGINEPIFGEVTYLGDIIDKETRTLKARVELKNPGQRLKPGMFVQVKILQNDKAKALILIPEDAVQRIGRVSFVFVQEKPGHYEKRKVTLGPRSGSRIAITQGLSAGEKVVVSGSFWLKSQLSKSQLGGGHSH